MNLFELALLPVVVVVVVAAAVVVVWEEKRSRRCGCCCLAPITRCAHQIAGNISIKINVINSVAQSITL